MTSTFDYSKCPSRQKTIEKICPACGGHFFTSPKHKDQVACSMVCGRAVQHGRVGTITLKVCRVCRKDYRSCGLSKERYCSRKCSAIAGKIQVEADHKKREARRRECVICGASFLPANPHKKRMQLTCSKECGGFKQEHPVGTRRIDNDGYVWVKLERGKWDHEHVVIAEKEIGRSLFENEVVHHRNGVRGDNRPENLQVMTRAEHIKLHHIAERFGRSMLAQMVALPMLAGEWVHPLEGCEV